MRFLVPTGSTQVVDKVKVWEPELRSSYQPHYASTDDAERDHETTLAEDQGPKRLEEIAAVCRHYGVRARLSIDGKLVGEMNELGAYWLT